MPSTTFYGRRAVAIENDALRVTVLCEGGHIAELLHKPIGVSPLWIPPWKTIEPSAYDPRSHELYGSSSDARLLAGLMGHNLCLDIFGAPSPAEHAAGITVHGEASVAEYQISEQPRRLRLTARLPKSQLLFARTIELHHSMIEIREQVKNVALYDRPIAWTQHVTLGPPFLDPQTTQFEASVGRSMVQEVDPGKNGYLINGAIFQWPLAPKMGGGMADLRSMQGNPPASSYSTHLTNREAPWAYFAAFSTGYCLCLYYMWRPTEFPWLGIWEEHCSRQHMPWNGRVITRGMEFGMSPFPETRHSMVTRPALFDAPMFGWLPAGGDLNAEYWVALQPAITLPTSPPWPPAN
jgi:hypothetical protein